MATYLCIEIWMLWFQCALAPYKNLPQEIESLKTVLEMRNDEINKLRSTNTELKKKVYIKHFSVLVFLQVMLFFIIIRKFKTTHTVLVELGKIPKVISDFSPSLSFLGSVHGLVVSVVDLELRAPHCCGFESHQGLWIFFMWGSYPASLQYVTVFTWVPACALNNVWTDTWALPVKMESHHII